MTDFASRFAVAKVEGIPVRGKEIILGLDDAEQRGIANPEYGIKHQNYIDDSENVEVDNMSLLQTSGFKSKRKNRRY